MGNCYTKDGNIIQIPNPQAAETCFANGGYEWKGMTAAGINPNFPCPTASACNGKTWTNPGVGVQMCGPGNKMIYCRASPTGGQWENSDIDCDENSDGRCPTHCGELKLCDETIVAKTPVGETKCGSGNITFTCDAATGAWTAGAPCTCMTVCPPLATCDGEATLQKPGAQVCGADRKTRICEKNLMGPPTWTYGKKCACPGDPPEVVLAPPPAPTGPAPPKAVPASDNTIMYAAVGFILFLIIIMVVVALMMSRKKRGRGEMPLTYEESQ